MFNVNGYEIEISRGDTASIEVTFSGDDIPEDGTIALVTLQKGKNTLNNIWEKRLEISEGAVTVAFSVADTDIDAGNYLWDIRLLYENGEVYTPFEPQTFTVLGVVGDVSVSS